MKKILISTILVLILVIAGSSYCIITLMHNMESLETRLTAQNTETEARLAGEIRQASENLTAVLTSARANLESNIEEANIRINTAGTRIDGLNEMYLQASEGISGLDIRLENTETTMSRSVIDANAVYEKVKQSIVRISDGQDLLGSGFLLGAEMLDKVYYKMLVPVRVVTAYHVVEDLDTVYITTHDGRVFKGWKRGYSKEMDLAFLAITALSDGEVMDTRGLVSAEIGDSASVSTGDPCVVIGSPGDGQTSLGLRETVTTGVVSQINRSANIDGNTVANLLQIDAAVNYGNSGCPVFNLEGKVIGIAIARINPSLGDGIGWVVASNQISLVDDFYNEAGDGIQTSYDYPLLGIQVTDLTPQYVEENDNAVTTGVLVKSVSVGSPAAAAGLRADDVVIAMDDRTVRDIGEMLSFLAAYYTPGDKLVLEVLRDGVSSAFELTVGKR